MAPRLSTEFHLRCCSGCEPEVLQFLGVADSVLALQESIGPGFPGFLFRKPRILLGLKGGRASFGDLFLYTSTLTEPGTCFLRFPISTTLVTLLLV